MSRRAKLRREPINQPACFTSSFFLLKDILLLLRLLMNLCPFFSTCIWWDVNGMFPFKVFRATSEMAFIRASKTVQSIAFLCWGEDQINSSRRERLLQTLGCHAPKSVLVATQGVGPAPLYLLPSTGLLHIKKSLATVVGKGQFLA